MALPAKLPRRLAVAALVVALGVLLAGCGGSNKSASTSGSSTITVGSEPSSNANASANPPAVDQGTGKTPSSGPLSQEPKIVPPKEAAPTHLVVDDLIKGTGPAAQNEDALTVNYVGALYHGGKVFDASWLRKQPLSFALGEGQVIPGWDQGLIGMRVGGRRELIIPPSLAYGSAGSGSKIPPNSPLIFIVDLLKIQAY
jgi:peptidylprolyl isomerase